MVKYQLCVGGIETRYIYSNLKELDFFTSHYRNEKAFLEYLKNSGMIKEIENQNIYIKYTYKYPRVLDVIYKENTLFFSPNNLENSYYKIQDAIYSFFDNKDFLRKLYFLCKEKANSNAIILSNYINGSIIEYGEKNQFVSDLCESLLVNYSNGNRNYNYKNMRDLGLIICKFSNSKKSIVEKESGEKQIFTPLECEQLSFFKK